MPQKEEKRILFSDEKTSNRQAAAAQRTVSYYNQLLNTIEATHPSLMNYYEPENYYHNAPTIPGVGFNAVLVHLCELVLHHEFGFSEGDVSEMKREDLFRLLKIGALPKFPHNNKVNERSIYHLHSMGYATFDPKTKRFKLMDGYLDMCLENNTIEITDPDDIKAWDKIVDTMESYIKLKTASFTRGKNNRSIEMYDEYFHGLKYDKRKRQFYCDDLSGFNELKTAFV